MNLSALHVTLTVILSSSMSLQSHSADENINDDRIMGGETAKPNQFPYQVSLRARRKSPNNTITIRHRCGGSIISNRWILSAAHCMQNDYSKPSSMVACVGAHHIRNDGHMHHLDRVIRHPSFNKAVFRNDIGLLRTTTTIRFDNTVQSIPLRKQIVEEGSVSTITGWGKWQLEGDILRPTQLQLLRMKTITNEECRRRHLDRQRTYIYDGCMCTFAAKGQGACFGDSGGPLVSNGQLIGVVSWGLPCGRGRPDGFARISSFVKWIQEITGVIAV